MTQQFFEDTKFEDQDFTQKKFLKATYDYCEFLNCNFNNQSLADATFIECTFKNCDLSTVNLANTSLKVVSFENCKMLGIRFDYSNPFMLEINFKDCNLQLSSFYKMKLPKQKFVNCDLQEVDFVEAFLEAAVFENCNLQDAMFDNTFLEKSDFSTAQNFVINPIQNHIKNAYFAQSGIIGLVQHFGIKIEKG